jgi:nucleotide-binding universal stress UspA family protein
MSDILRKAEMYNRILVAIDGSDTSLLALKEAIGLATVQGSVLRLVHIVEPIVELYGRRGVIVAEYQRTLEEAGQEVIADYSAMVRGAGIQFDAASIGTELPGQCICNAIEEEAKRWKADLIVVGTHGRRGFRHLLLGSVAEGLIRVASKPVLLIRGT